MFETVFETPRLAAQGNPRLFPHQAIQHRWWQERSRPLIVQGSDPTSQIHAGFELIPVAVARHPGQAIPLEGSWFGDAKDYLGMTVNVAVNKIGDVTNSSEE